MNKLLMSIVLCGMAFVAQATNAAPTNTVLEVMTFQDDTPVVLRGKIDRSLGRGKYQFSDATGTIVLDIDDKDTSFLAEDVVEVYGEVDKGWFSTEIDVEEIIKK